MTHLHVHTEYSLLGGAAGIKDLLTKTKTLGMTALAITDQGVMYGAVNFYKEAKAMGIKPIIGCELYIVRDIKSAAAPGSLILLAQNQIGYENLIKLVSYGAMEGSKPRISVDMLKDHAEGLTALCFQGLTGWTLKETLKTYKKIFGENFYIEIQNPLINRELIELSRELNIPPVAANHVHYLNPDDHLTYQVLQSIQRGEILKNKTLTGDFYLKSPEEMKRLFSHIPEALENTDLIASRCNLNFVFHEYKLPKFPTEREPFEYLKEICREGLSKKHQLTQELLSGLDYELNVINNMGFVDYFLITWDFIKYAKDNNIRVGPGRGSAAGSLVSYALDITTVDPVKYGLLFERFLNPQRVSMPDIDIDFCYKRRQEVIDYCIKKYGQAQVAQIITFGTMAARAAIRDVGRVLNYPYAQVDPIAKAVPRELNITLDKALKTSRTLRDMYNTDFAAKEIIDLAKKLEGLPRHVSTHAAGVIISEKPLIDYIPLHQNDGVVVTGYAMDVLEELGLLKMDFLGLRTLTIINMTLDEIKRVKGEVVDIDNLDYDDKNVYKLIASGNTDGLFQLESAGVKKMLRELKPDKFEEIIAGIALYRPGPMDFIPKYIASKFGKKVEYLHPALEPILKTTYGCIVYQEQVLQIVRDLAKYSLGRSDLLRRAISKKKSDEIQRERQNFIYGNPDENLEGCVKNDIPAHLAEEIFDQITDFANYAFNKSHAAAYAVIAYQTAFLKTYYPHEFMTAVMSTSGTVDYYAENCRAMSIPVLKPDVNAAMVDFSVENNAIRHGLLAIKNVGKNTAKAIVSERENGKYTSIEDFIRRIKNRDLNKKCVEALLEAGAFDSLGNRADLRPAFAPLLESHNREAEGQLSLFDLTKQSPKNQEKRQEKRELWLKIEKTGNLTVKDLAEILKKHRGNTPVIVYHEESGKKYALTEEYWSDSSLVVLEKLRRILGEKSVVFRERKSYSISN